MEIIVAGHLSESLIFREEHYNLHTGKNEVARNQLATLSNGIYMIEVEQSGILIGRGKIVVNK